MEFVPLSDTVLRILANEDRELKKIFRGVFAADQLPTVPKDLKVNAYIVITDPAGKPGEHSLAILNQGDVCEVLDSYGLPLQTYKNPQLQAWFAQRPYLLTSAMTLQAMDS